MVITQPQSETIVIPVNAGGSCSRFFSRSQNSLDRIGARLHVTWQAPLW